MKMQKVCVWNTEIMKQKTTRLYIWSHADL